MAILGANGHHGLVQLGYNKTCKFSVINVEISLYYLDVGTKKGSEFRYKNVISFRLIKRPTEQRRLQTNLSWESQL